MNELQARNAAMQIVLEELIEVLDCGHRAQLGDRLASRLLDAGRELQCGVAACLECWIDHVRQDI